MEPPTGRHQRSWRGGTTSGNAFLDDYTGVVAALIDLYQANFDVHWLERAVVFQRMQDELFWDARAAISIRWATTGRCSPGCATLTNGAEPAPNSRAAMNLLRLALITGGGGWKDKTDRTLALFGWTMASRPESLPALGFALAPERHILIAGDPNAVDTKVLIRVLNERYLPNAVPMLADGGVGRQQIARWLPFVAAAHPISGRAAAYVCHEMICKMPTPEPAVMARLLDARRLPGDLASISHGTYSENARLFRT